MILNYNDELLDFAAVCLNDCRQQLRNEDRGSASAQRLLFYLKNKSAVRNDKRKKEAGPRELKNIFVLVFFLQKKTTDPIISHDTKYTSAVRPKIQQAHPACPDSQRICTT
jgi:hypothetical protein